MRNLRLLPLLTILLLGCETDTKLTFEEQRFTGRNCETCPKVIVTIPHALDNLKIAKTINTAFREEVIYALKFNDTIDVATIKDAIDAFEQSYESVLAEFGPTSQPWEADLSGNVVFQNDAVVTVVQENYMDTGGAHGYSSKIFMNFDRKLGTELEQFELWSDQDGFLQLAESKFRKTYNIPESENINATGFMFEDDSFYLPENFGFTEEGIELHYNQYEVASYADGPLTITIPYQEALPFLQEAYHIKS